MDDGDPPLVAPGDHDDAHLWLLPGPSDNGSDPFLADAIPRRPRPGPVEADVVDAWRAAEAGHAARLPPLHLEAAGAEMLLDDTMLLARRAALPQRAAALRRIAAFVQEMLCGGA